MITRTILLLFAGQILLAILFYYLLPIADASMQNAQAPILSLSLGKHFIQNIFEKVNQYIL